MKKTNLIVFDIDGTLTDSVAIHQQAFIESLKDIGVRCMNTNFKEYKHHTDSYIAKLIYENDLKQEFSSTKLQEFEIHLYKKTKKQSINEILGAQKLIWTLQTDSSFGICFATGSLEKPAEYKLNSIGITYDTELLTASNTLHSRESIVQQSIDNSRKFYNVNSFKRIISVGDGLWDLKTADNLNLEFIGIGNKNKDILFQNGMKNHFEDLRSFKI